MVRDGKPKGVFYLDHRTVDGRPGMITDTHTTPASVHDSIPYLDRLERQRERFDLGVRAVGLDAGYATAGTPPRGWKTGRSSVSPAIGVARARVPA